MNKTHNANKARLKRHRRLRNRVQGTMARPRLSVFRSATNIYAQVIDDSQSRTLAAASSNEPEFAAFSKGGPALPEGEEVAQAIKGLTQNARIKQAWLVGSLIAQRATAQGIGKVVFDRGGYIYHGRVAALAEGARKGGLEF